MDRIGVAALLALSGCMVDGLAEPGPAAGGCDPDDGSLELLHGFCASVVADGLGKARHLAVTPSGDLYVAVQDARDGSTEGGLLSLLDLDEDGRTDTTAWVYRGGGNGLTWADGQLYFAQDDRVLRFHAPDGQPLDGPGEPEVVVSGLPADGDHPATSVVVRGDDLFLHVGSASNACQEENRVAGSPGLDPCPELDTRAGIWRFDADGTDQIQADGEHWATGLRNANALAIRPATGELYAAPNGRDQLRELWPELYSPAGDYFLPAEALYRVEQGTDAGWPYCYYDPAIGHVLAPEYGGDGVEVGRCADADPPVSWFPARWAPLGMHFYDGAQFPEEFQGGLFVAFHGSWLEAPPVGPLLGYQVSFVPFGAEGPEQIVIPFAWDFAGPGRPLPDAAEYRPVGVTEGPDGSLYVSDDAQGRIWRISYVGP